MSEPHDLPPGTVVPSPAHGGAVTASRTRRLARRVRRSEEGSQVAEYAMVGGVGAAACGAVIVVVNQGGFLENLLNGPIFDAISGLVSRFLG